MSYAIKTSSGNWIKGVYIHSEVFRDEIEYLEALRSRPLIGDVRRSGECYIVDYVTASMLAEGFGGTPRWAPFKMKLSTYRDNYEPVSGPEEVVEAAFQEWYRGEVFRRQRLRERQRAFEELACITYTVSGQSIAGNIINWAILDDLEEPKKQPKERQLTGLAKFLKEKGM